MGIIRKQSIHNSISLYTGIFIGAVNTILIYPFVFESNPEYWGLLQILVSYSVIFSSFSHLGGPSIFIRFFPKAQVKSELLSFIKTHSNFIKLFFQPLSKPNFRDLVLL